MAGVGRAILLIVIGVVGGVAIGLGVGRFLPLPADLGGEGAPPAGRVTELPRPEPRSETPPEPRPLTEAPPPAAPAEAEAGPVKWRMASMFGSDLPLLGTLGKRLGSEIAQVSEGGFEIAFFEPGALVPPLEGFDAVASGKVDAVWGTAAYWVEKIPAAQWFAAVPFGPAAAEYLAWLDFGGGQRLWDEIYAKHGVKAIVCGIAPPEAAGWFRKRVASVGDLAGLRMRFYGMGAVVLERLGVVTQDLDSKDIYPALEAGRIDAAEFSFPALDVKLGLSPVAGNYYFPGWHQQTTILELLVNRRAYGALAPVRKRQLSAVCGDGVRRGLASGGALQSKALATLKAEGVRLRRLPPDVVEALKKAWGEVIESFSAKDADFKRVARSFAAFRRDYKLWKSVAYVD